MTGRPKDSLRWFAGLLLSLLAAGCASSPRPNTDAPERLVPDTRTAAVPELGDREATVISGPRERK